MSAQSWLYFPSGSRIDIAYYRESGDGLPNEIWVSGYSGNQAVLTDSQTDVSFTGFGFDADPSGAGYVAIIGRSFYDEALDIDSLQLLMQPSAGALVDWTADRDVADFAVFSGQVSSAFFYTGGQDLNLRRPNGDVFTSVFSGGSDAWLLFPGIWNGEILAPLITGTEIFVMRYSIELENALFTVGPNYWHIDSTGTTTELDVSGAELLTSSLANFSNPEYHYRHPILYAIDIPDAYTSGTATIYENTIDLEAGTMVLTNTLSESCTGRSSYDNYEVLQYIYYP